MLNSGVNKFNKIVFVIGAFDPRLIRRIESVVELGYDVEVYGYYRNVSHLTNFSSEFKVNMLGTLDNGRAYWTKFKKINFDVDKILKIHNKENVLYYSEGILITTVLRLKGAKYVYEISDILYAEGKWKYILPLWKCLDRHLVSNSIFTVMTSEGFKRFLNVPNANVVIQPNRVSNKIRGCQRNVLSKHDEGFIFSFVGSIRYETIFRFAEVIGKYFPQHQFHFYGEPELASTQSVIQSLISKYSNIKIFGRFKNPDDFERIYNSIDIVVITYGHSFNENILDPNKLYEGILFCRPLIATEGTFIASQLERYQCGFAIDSSSEEDIKKAIEQITPELINQYSANEKNLDENCAFDNVDEISHFLNSLVSKD
jgi:glycosyltransferase involved in cell wall biosynthesis